MNPALDSSRQWLSGNDGSATRGRLKVFLGFAAGVGKTYQMLDEAQAMHTRGVDVVIGYFEPHGRKDTIAKTEGLETIPRRVMEYRGSRFEEMDAPAILARKPQVCVVDEFPHTNIPGSERDKRWQDVLALLEHGIHVLTTMNIQHLESLNDQVFHITGVRVRETIPDWVVKQADEVVMVDLTPQALLNRLERGVVYAPEKAKQAVANFFREPALAALREMAMRQTAHEVDSRQTVPAPGTTSGQHLVGRLGIVAPAQAAQERILLHITDEPSTAALIRRARRVADYLQAECLAAAVHHDSSFSDLPPEIRQRLEKHLNFARNLHIETRVLQGEEVAEALVDYARSNRVTQIFLTRPANVGWEALLGRSLIQRVVQLARDMRVVIVAERRGVGAAG